MDVNKEPIKCEVTLFGFMHGCVYFANAGDKSVISTFLDFLDILRSCVDFRVSTEVSRFISQPTKLSPSL